MPRPNPRRTNQCTLKPEEPFNILAAREHTGSTIVTSQFTPKDWYASIPDAVIAESILNRLVVGAEIITLEGPNMRLEANE
ncbi:ATP-binding protein [Corynebacterium striatum]|uniref:ATP-binding protein n=1 Tax=Corynebacterium striatum TaxID=43770 RepID=UPI0027B91E77|nr:ATP-binding protein [Corynebacterium striatum]